jgi:hemolysin III
MDHKSINTYSPLEEKINIYSHVLGAVLGGIALILFMIKAARGGTSLEMLSNLIFCISVITLYSISAQYHSAIDPQKRFRLKIIDHSAIYILIAGTYTPYALNLIKGVDGWVLFGVAWGMALIGITLKVFFTGRFKILSTLMYVFMGWIIIFYIKPLTAVISNDGFAWLLIGGVSYTVGALIYTVKRVPLNHATFHIFVLLGSIGHFISIFFYI